MAVSDQLHATLSLDDYADATARSRALWERASDVFPQGISGQAKWFAPYPVFVNSAQGSHITDVDGRDYVDLLMGAGPLLLGHGHPYVVEAVQRQAARMFNPMMPNEQSIELAERLQGHMPHLERMRFVNTGSEATRSAVRVARAATGRTLIAKFEGNYHGSDDLFLISTHSTSLPGTRERPEPVLDYAGMSPRLLDETVILPYNDAENSVAIIKEHADQLAAVIMEPVSFSSGGGVPADPEFVSAIRRVTRDNGIVLIFDEVLCALRFGLQGAPAYTGQIPDLVTIGKAVGGGLPLAAFGGSAELMESTLGSHAGRKKIFQSGTFTENPMSIAAGSATLTILETTNALDNANRTGERLREGLRRVLAARGQEATVTGIGSIVQLHMGVSKVTCRRDSLTGDRALTADIMLGCVANGVLWPPVHPAVTSSEHTDADIDRVLEVVDSVMARIEQAR